MTTIEKLPIVPRPVSRLNAERWSENMATPSARLEKQRIILSALWAARTFSSLQGDAMRLSDPQMLQSLIAGSSEFPVTPELLLAFSPILALPIFMVFLSLSLRRTAARRASLMTGIFFILWDIAFMSLLYLNSAVYEVFWGAVYLVFAILIVWNSWNWSFPGER